MRGSGYIEHPPQVPFAGRIVMQPTTIGHDDVPEWFEGQQHSGGYSGGRGRGGNHYPQQPRGGGGRHYGGRGYQSGHHGGYQSAQHTNHRGQQLRPYTGNHTYSHQPPHQQHYRGNQQQHGAPQPRLQHYQQHQPAVHGGGSGTFNTSSLQAALPQTRNPPAPPPVPVSTPVQQMDDIKMSKSQKAKMRKKLREGKA